MNARITSNRQGRTLDIRGLGLLLLTATALALGAGLAHSDGIPVYKEGTRAVPQAWPGDANARDGVQMEMVDGDSTRYLVRGNASTGVVVSVSNPPQGWIYRYQSIIQSSTISKQAPDSSACYPARGATRWLIRIYPTYDDSTAATVLLIALRGHPVQSADSLSTYVNLWRRSRQNPASSTTVAATGAAGQDSIGSIVEVMNGSSWATGSAQSGDYVVPLGPGKTPRGREFWIDWSDDFLSVFARVAATYNSAGSAYSASTEPHLTYRMDAYGYR
jgi:hypothetical protein